MKYENLETIKLLNKTIDNELKNLREDFDEENYRRQLYKEIIVNDYKKAEIINAFVNDILIGVNKNKE